jgi:CheY-like chemotaxis protein
MLLEFEGHTVHEAGDGLAGLELVANNADIRIAFVDIGLPGMSGYDVARELRKRRGAKVRLVAMSGYGAESDVEQGMQAGFDAYIVKPAEIEALQEQIAKA